MDVETPPRAWGRLEKSTAAKISARNTPTCVGKTRHGACLTTLSKKHPHVRGEDYIAAEMACLWVGNTPTCVGKTAVLAQGGLGGGKHPHVRGEDLRAMRTGICRVETPPRAWGRRAAKPNGGATSGNTPTCVGKTTSHTERKRRHGKHPHVRGEDARSARTRLHKQETPPRAWGRLGAPCTAFASARNTPTCVGKTAANAQIKLLDEKHPHVRGEDFSKTSPFDTRKETPPRAWGRQGQ